MSRGTAYVWYTMAEVIGNAEEMVEIGWTVVAVRPNAVHLWRDDESLVIRVLRDGEEY